MNGSSGILDERDTGTSEKEKTPESSQLSLTLEPEYGQDQEEEDRLLGEVFSLSPRASSPHRDLVTRQEFLNSVLVIKGVTTFLSQMQNVTDKESLLNLDIMIPTNEEEHIVYVLLSYISQSLFTTENDDFRWIEEAVKSILEISNETFRHTFIEDSREICREFLDNVLLPELVTEKGVAVTRVVRAFSSNQVFGSVIVNFLLQKLLEIGDLLREAERYKLDHLPILETFHHHNRMILEIWPSYAQGEIEQNTCTAHVNAFFSYLRPDQCDWDW